MAAPIKSGDYARGAPWDGVHELRCRLQARKKSVAQVAEVEATAGRRPHGGAGWPADLRAAVACAGAGRPACRPARTDRGARRDVDQVRRMLIPRSRASDVGCRRDRTLATPRGELDDTVAGRGPCSSSVFEPDGTTGGQLVHQLVAPGHVGGDPSDFDGGRAHARASLQVGSALDKAGLVASSSSSTAVQDGASGRMCGSSSRSL